MNLEPAAATDVSILKPVLEDGALMAMIRSRHVPFAFVHKQTGLPLDVESATAVAQALMALRPGQNSVHVAGVIELDVRFTLRDEVLHVSGGSLVETRGVTWLDQLTPAHIEESLSPKSKSIGREFAAKRYKELRAATDVYNRVMRECERSDSIESALQRIRVSRAPLEKEHYERIKAMMARYGLSREPTFGRQILLEGSLARQIEQTFLGSRLDEVVPQLLRRALELPREG